MKKIISFLLFAMLYSCSAFKGSVEKKEGFKMITAIGNYESNGLNSPRFESKGLLDSRYDIEIYATQDSLKTELTDVKKLFKKRSKKPYIKLSLINSVEIIEHLNSEYSELSTYIIENPKTQIITDIYVFVNSAQSNQILSANALFLNKTKEGIYRVKTVTGIEVDYFVLNQKDVFDFSSKEFCVVENYYDSKIISIGEDCKSKKKKKKKKERYDRL